MVISLAAAALGIVLLVLGLKGRRTGSDPLCRRCRFSLAGLYPGVPVCPECGSDLASTEAPVLIGIRRRSRPLILLGALALLGGGGYAGAQGWAWATGFDWNTIKPEWWLLSDLGRSQPLADAAMKEILRRHNAATLTPSAAAAAAAAAFAHQADPTTSWTADWASFLESARTAGILTQQQTAAYARTAAIVTMRARASVVHGQEWLPALNIAGGRVADLTGMYVQAKALAAHLDDTPLPRTEFSASGAFDLGTASRGAMNSTFRIDLPPGPHTFKGRWLLSVTDGREINSPAFCEWEQEFTLPVEVLPPGTPVITLVPDPSLQPQLEQAIRADQAEVQRWLRYAGTEPALASRSTEGHTQHWSPSADSQMAMASGMIHLSSPNAPLAFDILWRYHGPAGEPIEVVVGGLHVPASTGGYGFGYSREIPADTLPERVDIILRASPAIAAKSIDLTEIWDGQIVIRNVPVKQSSPK